MLPTCPSCGQSVLDDEAADCPFCGASMSGKPGKSKPAPAKAAPTKSAEPKKPKPKKPDEENPFETAPARTKTAVQAAPKPMKGRLLKVVCPMCDTPGFIPKKAAGRDIRCSNKKCMVPVFKAPKVRREPVAAAEPEKGGGSLPLIIGGLVALGVIGGVLFFLFGNKGGAAEEIKPAPKVATTEDKTNRAEEIYQKTLDKQPTVDTGPLPLDKLRDVVVEEIGEAAEKSNSDKPFCRRMTSEGLVAAGQFDKAEKEIDLIARPGDARFYQRTFPLVDLAWAHLDAGDADKATEVTTQAENAAAQLPRSGRAEFEARAELAALLAAVGRVDDAAKMLNASRSLDDEIDRRSAVAAARTVVQLAAAETGSSIVPVGIAEPVSPVWAAAVNLLCLRGKGDVAADLAAQANGDEAVLADALASVGATSAAKKQSSAVSKLKQVAGSASPVVQARVHAAIAYGAALSGDKTVAANAMQQAEAVLATLPQPNPIEINKDDARAMYRFQPPKPGPSVLAAKATAEVARAQAQLDKTDVAKATLQTAIAHAHSFCPSARFMADRMDEGMTARRLADVLGLGENQARTAVNRFNGKVKSLAKTATERTALQTDILETLAGSKLGGTVWEMVNPKGDGMMSKNEKFIQTGLPWRVVTAFWAIGKDAEAATMVGSLDRATKASLVEGAEVLDAEIDGHMNPGQAERTAGVLAPRDLNRPGRLKQVYRLAMWHADADLGRAMDFAKGIGNVQWRREILNLVATTAAAKGQGRELVEFAEQPGFEPPDRTAIYRGFIAGVKLDPKFDAPAQ